MLERGVDVVVGGNVEDLCVLTQQGGTSKKLIVTSAGQDPAGGKTPVCRRRCVIVTCSHVQPHISSAFYLPRQRTRQYTLPTGRLLVDVKGKTSNILNLYRLSLPSHIQSH